MTVAATWVPRILREAYPFWLAERPVLDGCDNLLRDRKDWRPVMGGAKKAYFDDHVDWRSCEGGCRKRYPSTTLNQMGMGQDG